LILGLAAGFAIGSLLDKASRDLMVERHELELTHARNTIHDQADKLSKAESERATVSDLLKQAQTIHEADAAKITQQQGEIEKLDAAAKAPPTKAPSKVPRVEVSKVTFHLPDSEKGFFFNYWISNRSDVVIKGAVPEAGQGLSDHLLSPVEEKQSMGAAFGASMFPLPNISQEIGPREENAEWFTVDIPNVTAQQLHLLAEGKLLLYVFIVIKYGDEASGKMNVSETCMYYTQALDASFNCQVGKRVYAEDSPAPYK
jgi:hypothetical protein